MYNFTQARDIIYKYVCDVTDNLLEVEIISALPESQLSVSDWNLLK
jgi:hypothetical protein